mgnify:CR=1 FL=1
MSALDAIAGIATPAADAPEAARPTDDAARASTTRAVEAIGFDLLFAALLGSAAPTPDAPASDASVGEPPLTSDDAVLLADGARTAESASYAARRAGVSAAAPWKFGAPHAAGLTAPDATTLDGVAAPTDAGATPASTGATATGRTARKGTAATSLGASADDTTSATAASPAVDALASTLTPLAQSSDVAALVPPAVPPAPAARSSSADASPTDVPAVATSSHAEALATVAPALRGKLDRVIERMQREFGHDVRIVEGRRSQARQDALFAQGRTAPGPVVTWTRDSAHLDGEAVDVMIDGGYDNAEAFRTLARVARQEGLRSLGPKDPGHLELAEPAAQAPTNTTGIADVASVARVARPAATAAPAAVATVASVARVATPGAPRISTVAATQPKTASEGERPARVAADATSDVIRSTREPSRSAARERVEELVARLSPPLATGTTADTPLDAAAAVPGVDLTARLEAVARVRDAQAAQPLSRLVMDVPDAIGGVDRIAVALRGQRLDATLAIQDPGTAARVAQRVEALAEALGARGYEPGTLAVSAARGIAPESLDLTRLTGLAMEREGTRGVASFLQDLGGGGLRDRQHSPGRQHDSSASSRGDEGARGETPRRQSRRDPGDR